MPLMSAVGRNTTTSVAVVAITASADLGDRLLGRLTHGLALAQVPHDVLDLDDRIVDEDADHDGEREQRDAC